MNILIIEDEQRTALDLQTTIREVEPEAQFPAILDTVDAAVEWFRSKPAPDIAFFDIQLADGLSFDIFEEVDIHSPIIFCTAYGDYALRAFQSNGVDYILKPFDKESIRRAIDKVKRLENFFQKNNGELAEKLGALLSNLRPAATKSTFLVNQRDKLLPIPVTHIAYFYIEHEMAFLQTFDNQRYFANHTLDELEKLLDPHLFYRANRQFLISRTAITEAQHFFARKLLVKLSVPTKEQVIVSKAKASDFLKWIEGA